MTARRKFLPLRIAPGIALSIAIALVALQAATFGLLYALAPGEIQVFGGRWLAERISETSREILLRARAERPQALAGVTIDPAITVELRERWQPPGEEGPERGRSAWLGQLIRRQLADGPGEGRWEVEAVVYPPGGPWLAGAPRPQFVPQGSFPAPASTGPGVPGRRMDLGIPARFRIAVKGPDGQWLLFRARPPWASWRQLALVGGWLALAAALIGTLSWLAARRVIRPLEAMAEAGARIGALRPAIVLPEQGPPELRAIARRLNDMQQRLHRFVDDRTQMIAAISHDLRTPLTRMRLRAEFVEDRQERQKLLEDIAQMEAIVAQTVDFARLDATAEPEATFDLASLLGSLCDDASDAGRLAGYDGPGQLQVRGQPVALRRAFANLIDNAILYGGRADVSLQVGDGRAVVRIADAGPGLPEEALEAVFRPFYRLEASRNRDSGGTGLGLSIARTILRAHGGDVTLANAATGLVATAELPLP